MQLDQESKVSSAEEVDFPPEFPTDMSEQEIYIRTGVFKLFASTQAQTSKNVQTSTVFQLKGLFRKSPTHFQKALLEVYIKILQTFQTKQSYQQVVIEKFENLMDQFFRQLFQFGKIAITKEFDLREIHKQIILFNAFLQLMLDAGACEFNSIRIIGARLSFIITAQVPQPLLGKIISLKTLEIYEETVSRMLSCQSQARQFGIKLASMIQDLQPRSPKGQEIMRKLFKIASDDDSQGIRKLVITNIRINKGNLDLMLKRLRDKNMDIKLLILRKLIAQKYIIDESMDKFQLPHIYKVLYDGYGGKESIMKKESTVFFSMFFDQCTQLFKQLHSKDINKVQSLQKLECFLVEKHQAQKLKDKQNKIYSTFSQFVSLFEPLLLIANPHLYSTFDSLIRGLMSELSSELVSCYITYICKKFKEIVYRALQKVDTPAQQLSVVCCSLIWLKHSIKSAVPKVALAFEQECPSGKQISLMLKILFFNRELYGCFELLRYFEKIIDMVPDQIGRNAMFACLQNELDKLQFYQPIYSTQQRSKQAQENANQRPNKRQFSTLLNYFQNQQTNLNPICTIPPHKDVEYHKLLSPYYHSPIVTSSYDLIFHLAQAMKNLKPESYEQRLREIIAGWNRTEDIDNEQQQDSQCVSEFKKKNLIALIASLQSKEQLTTLDASQIQRKKLQLRQLVCRLSLNEHKSKIAVLTLSKLNPECSLESYLDRIPIIKKLMGKKDKSEGLILLSHHCMRSLQVVKVFLPVYLGHLSQHKVWRFGGESSLKVRQICIVLRIISDFIIKFNILKSGTQIYKDQPIKGEQQHQNNKNEHTIVQEQNQGSRHKTFQKESEYQLGQLNKDDSDPLEAKSVRSNRQIDIQAVSGHLSQLQLDSREAIFTSNIFMATLYSLLFDTQPQIRSMAVESLCRLLYHQRIPEEETDLCLLFLVLLRITTETQSQNSKLTYTISMFMQCYLDPSTGRKQNSIKMTKIFCVFFHLLKEAQTNKKNLNRSLTSIPVTIELLMKQGVLAAIGMLRVKKSPKKRTVKQGEVGGLRETFNSQELLILYLLSDTGCQQIVDKAIQISDFYTNANCPIESLVLVKQRVQEIKERDQRHMEQQGKSLFNSTAKSIINKFELQMCQYIKGRSSTLINQQELDSCQETLKKFIQQVHSQANRLTETIETLQNRQSLQEIFISLNLQERIQETTQIIGTKKQSRVPRSRNKVLSNQIQKDYAQRQIKQNEINGEGAQKFKRKINNKSVQKIITDERFPQGEDFKRDQKIKLKRNNQKNVNKGAIYEHEEKNQSNLDFKQAIDRKVVQQRLEEKQQGSNAASAFGKIAKKSSKFQLRKKRIVHKKLQNYSKEKGVAATKSIRKKGKASDKMPRIQNNSDTSQPEMPALEEKKESSDIDDSASALKNREEEASNAKKHTDNQKSGLKLKRERKPPKKSEEQDQDFILTVPRPRWRKVQNLNSYQDEKQRHPGENSIKDKNYTARGESQGSQEGHPKPKQQSQALEASKIIDYQQRDGNQQQLEKEADYNIEKPKEGFNILGKKKTKSLSQSQMKSIQYLAGDSRKKKLSPKPLNNQGSSQEKQFQGQRKKKKRSIGRIHRQILALQGPTVAKRKIEQTDLIMQENSPKESKKPDQFKKDEDLLKHEQIKANQEKSQALCRQEVKSKVVKRKKSNEGGRDKTNVFKHKNKRNLNVVPGQSSSLNNNENQGNESQFQLASRKTSKAKGRSPGKGKDRAHKTSQKTKIRRQSRNNRLEDQDIDSDVDEYSPKYKIGANAELKNTSRRNKRNNQTQKSKQQKDVTINFPLKGQMFESNQHKETERDIGQLPKGQPTKIIKDRTKVKVIQESMQQLTDHKNIQRLAKVSNKKVPKIDNRLQGLQSKQDRSNQSEGDENKDLSNQSFSKQAKISQSQIEVKAKEELEKQSDIIARVLSQSESKEISENLSVKAKLDKKEKHKGSQHNKFGPKISANRLRKMEVAPSQQEVECKEQSAENLAAGKSSTLKRGIKRGFIQFKPDQKCQSQKQEASKGDQNYSDQSKCVDEPKCDDSKRKQKLEKQTNQHNNNEFHNSVSESILKKEQIRSKKLQGLQHIKKIEGSQYSGSSEHSISPPIILKGKLRRMRDSKQKTSLNTKKLHQPIIEGKKQTLKVAFSDSSSSGQESESNFKPSIAYTRRILRDKSTRMKKEQKKSKIEQKQRKTNQEPRHKNAKSVTIGKLADPKKMTRKELQMFYLKAMKIDQAPNYNRKSQGQSEKPNPNRNYEVFQESAKQPKPYDDVKCAANQKKQLDKCVEQKVQKEVKTGKDDKQATGKRMSTRKTGNSIFSQKRAPQVYKDSSFQFRERELQKKSPSVRRSSQTKDKCEGNKRLKTKKIVKNLQIKKEKTKAKTKQRKQEQQMALLKQRKRSKKYHKSYKELQRQD